MEKVRYFFGVSPIRLQLQLVFAVISNTNLHSNIDYYYYSLTRGFIPLNYLILNISKQGDKSSCSAYYRM